MSFNLYTLLRPVLAPVFKFLYRPKVINKELIPKNGNIIFAGHHTHALDPFLIGYTTKRTIRFLAKKELYKGLGKILFNLLGCLPVERDKKGFNDETIKKAEQILKNGDVIALFPEGTRNRTKEKLLPFKKGAVRFAKNTNSYIVPFYINGKFKMFKKGLTIVIGKPFKVTSDDLDKENDKLKDEILKLIEKGV